MDAPPPEGAHHGGPTSARSGSGRPLQRGVRGLFAVVFIVTAAAIVGNAALERAGLRAVAEERALLLARSIAEDVEAGQEVARTYLRVLASDPAVLAGDAAACEARAAQLSAVAGGSFGAIGLDGVAWCLEPNEPAPTYADRDWFAAVLASQGPYTSDFIIGRTTGIASVVLVEPLIREGALVSMATSGWALSQLVEAIDLDAAPPGTTVTVVDRGGVRLAQIPADGVAAGARLASDDPVAATIAADRPLVRTGPDGRTRLYTHAEVAAGHDVVVGWPTAAIYRAADARAAANAAFLLGAFALLFAWIVRRVRRDVLTPVAALGEAMDRFRSGAGGARIGSLRGPKELADVAARFDATVEALAQRTEDLRTAVHERERREQQVRQILRYSPSIITLLDAQGRYVEVGDAALALLGRPREEVIGRAPTEFQDPAFAPVWTERLGRVMAENRVLRVEDELPDEATGARRYFETLLFPVRDGDDAVVGVGAIATDVTDRHRVAEELERLAHADPLTGVGNRRALVALLDRLLPAAQRSGEVIAVGYLDLDGFKAINDRYGHAVGDAVLVEVASRIVGCVRAGDLVARLGGDEFAFVLRGLGGRADAQETCTRLAEAVAGPLGSGPTGQPLTASIGVALFPESGGTSEELLRAADAAMYEGKRARDGVVRFAGTVAPADG
jgi:diguanylate cyclase (GGDEF)-like protein/PAS domain S-box-containing protein